MTNQLPIQCTVAWLGILKWSEQCHSGIIVGLTTWILWNFLWNDTSTYVLFTSVKLPCETRDIYFRWPSTRFGLEGVVFRAADSSVNAEGVVVRVAGSSAGVDSVRLGCTASLAPASANVLQVTEGCVWFHNPPWFVHTHCQMVWLSRTPQVGLLSLILKGLCISQCPPWFL